MILIDKLTLFAGLPISLHDVCLIYHPTFKDIAELGCDKFNNYLLTLTVGEQQNADGVTISPFSFLYGAACLNPHDSLLITNAISFFVHDTVMLLPEMECFLIGDAKDKKFLTKDNFEDFQEVLSLMCWLKEARGIPESKRAKEIQDKINRAQRKVAEIKRKRGDDETLDLTTMLSSYLAKNPTVDYKSLWELPYYVFYDQFIRMRYIEEYDINTRAAMAGAKISKNKLRHWMRKTDNNQGGN